MSWINKNNKTPRESWETAYDLMGINKEKNPYETLFWKLLERDSSYRLPYLKILSEGSPGATGDINRAYAQKGGYPFSNEQDTAGVFEHRLAKDIIAEVPTHIKDYQKYGRAFADSVAWKSKEQRDYFGDRNAYGRHEGDKFMYPVKYKDDSSRKGDWSEQYLVGPEGQKFQFKEFTKDTKRSDVPVEAYLHYLIEDMWLKKWQDAKLKDKRLNQSKYRPTSKKYYIK